MVHRKRHGLFLVNVFAGLHSRDEAFAMQMLRRGDEDGIDRFVFQQVTVIEIGLGVGREFPGVFRRRV